MRRLWAICRRCRSTAGASSAWISVVMPLPVYRFPRQRQWRRSGSNMDIGFAGLGKMGGNRVQRLTIGGDRAVYDHLKPIFATLAPEQGEAYMGPSGAGHFVKMVHNGIEYGLMQSYAEGFGVLKNSEFGLDLTSIGEVWQHGSVVRSW